MMAYATMAMAQAIQGTVVDEHRKPLADVSIIVVNANAETLGFALTNELGHFTITIPPDTTALSVTIRALGYKSVTMKPSDFKGVQQIKLQPTAIKLKEVTVQGSRITQRGDTLSYLVNGFRQLQDRSIADVIARMPGLEVKSTGQITFEGKPINKFYIEGLDLMGSKYAQASENISANKVKSVQVLQNHQPVKSLHNVEFSDAAALNIRLTDDAKNVWTGMANVGGGISAGSTDVLYSGKLMTMLFAKKQQNISMYKADNSGRDISHEVNILTRESLANQEENGLLSNLSAVAPDLGSRRTTFNSTHLATTNHLFRSRHANDLRFQLDYLWDRTRGNMHQETAYNDLDTTLFSEDYQVTAIHHSMKGELKYELNKEKFYILNRIHGALNFDKSYGSTTLNGTCIEQEIRPRKHHITEDFRLIVPMGRHRSLRLSSQTTYNYLPGRLLTIEGQDEQLKMKTLESHSHVAFSHKIRNFNISYQAGLWLLHQQMDIDYTPTQGSERFSRQDAYLQATAHYALHDFRAQAELKFDGQHSSFDHHDKFHPMLLPSLSLKYDVSAESTVSAYYKYTERSNALADLFRTPTFTSYYTKRANSGLLDYRGRHALTLAWSYKHPLKGNFIDLTTSWQRRTNNVLYTTTHQGSTLLRKATDQRYSANTYLARGTAAHAFSWAKAFLSLSAEYSLQQFRLLQGEASVPCTLSNAMLELKMSMQPSPLFSCELNSHLYESRQRAKEGKMLLDGSKMRNATSALSLYFYPIKSVEIGCSNEWYINSTTESSSAYFLDVNVAYRTKKLEIRLDMLNLLGKDRYSNRIISTTTNTLSLYTLRPREAMLSLELSF